LDGRKIDAGAAIQHYTEAGFYHVLVNGSVNSKFTLTSTFQPEPNVLCTAFQRLGVGQSTTGQLAATSCKMPDGSAYDGWQTTVYGAGTLTLTMTATDFDSLLIWRGENGNLLAIDDNGGGGKNAQISLPVNGRETYTVLASAASAAEKPGVYQLSIAFLPNDDETCRPIAVITDPGQFNGSISAASCNFNLPDRQDSSPFNVYQLHVPEDGTAQLSVANSTFTPLLLLLDANGNPLVEDSESGGLYTPMIVQALRAGDYSILVYNEDSFEGDYTLQYGLAPGPAQLCPVQQINNGDAITGTLNGGANCRVSEFLSDTYRIVMPSSASLDLSLASSDFTTFLELRDAKGNLLTYGDQNNGTSAHLRAQLPAATYFVTAASVNLPGNYSLNAQITPGAIPACTKIQNLPVNTGFVAYLGQGTCIGLAGEPVDYYRFTTSADGTAALIMTSGDLDSYLTLTDSSGEVLRIDHNSYAQSDAIIVQFLKAGTYKLEARGRNSAGASRYRVDLLFTAGAKPPLCSADTIAIGALKNFTLTYTGCQYYDHTFANLYRFQVADPTKPVDISASSADFDTYLVLLDEKGNLISIDDNSGGGTDARLSGLLHSGVYFVIVKPADNPTQSGSYSLLLQQ